MYGVIIFTFKIAGKRKSWGSGMFLARPEGQGPVCPRSCWSHRTILLAWPTPGSAPGGEGLRGRRRSRKQRRGISVMGSQGHPWDSWRVLVLQGGHDPDHGAVPVSPPHPGPVCGPAARATQPLTPGAFPRPGKVGLGKAGLAAWGPRTHKGK